MTKSELANMITQAIRENWQGGRVQELVASIYENFEHPEPEPIPVKVKPTPPPPPPPEPPKPTSPYAWRKLRKEAQEKADEKTDETGEETAGEEALPAVEGDEVEDTPKKRGRPRKPVAEQ